MEKKNGMYCTLIQVMKTKLNQIYYHVSSMWYGRKYLRVISPEEEEVEVVFAKQNNVEKLSWLCIS